MIQTPDDGRTLTYHGELGQPTEGTITLICEGETCYGYFNFCGQTYEIIPLSDGLSALVTYEENGVSQCGVGQPDAVNDKPRRQPENDTGLLEKSSCGAGVRILVLYSPRAAATANPQQKATTFIANLNQIANNSAVTSANNYFALAGVELLDFDETHFFTMPDLWVKLANTNNPHPIHLEANQLRNDYGADLVIVFTDHYSSILGYAEPYEVGDEEWGYGIVEIDADPSRYTFSHEVAHLFGCRHQDDVQTEGNPNVASYANGHSFSANGQTNYTLLHTVGTGVARIMNISNPSINYSGVATGVTNQRDNARQMRNTRSLVACHRPDPTMGGVYISGYTSVEPGTTSTWCASSSGCSYGLTYTWAYSYDGFNYTTSVVSACATYTMPDVDNFWLRVTASCGNGATAVDYHRVSGNQGTGPEKDKQAAETSKPDVLDPMLSASPNPVQNLITVKLPATKTRQTATLFITTSSGRRVLHKQVAPGTEILYVNSGTFPPGMYLITYMSDQERQTLRVIKQ